MQVDFTVVRESLGKVFEFDDWDLYESSVLHVLWFGLILYNYTTVLYVFISILQYWCNVHIFFLFILFISFQALILFTTLSQFRS